MGEMTDKTEPHSIGVVHDSERFFKRRLIVVIIIPESLNYSCGVILVIWSPHVKVGIINIQEEVSVVSAVDLHELGTDTDFPMERRSLYSLIK